MGGALLGCATATYDEDDQLGGNDEGTQVATHRAALHCVEGESLSARGAFTCDFGLSTGVPLAQVPAVIERDRMFMSARPGMLSKHLPLSQDASGNLFSGGRYLFDTVARAAEYKSWVTNDFYLDGVEFLQRPIFLSPECHAWKVIGAYEFNTDDPSHVVMRTERWTVPEAQGNIERLLSAVWPAVVHDGEARGLSAVWLTYSRLENLVQLIYFRSGSASATPAAPDMAAISALASQPTYGGVRIGSYWTKTFDRTQFVFTRWYPFVVGDHGTPALWPNSPPFPEPSCGDGVCEVSRGENASLCSADCPLDCGDGLCQTNETTQSCPGDCRI